MERYEKISKVGEGSYGQVFKCRNKETGQIVAIKKFVESEDDPAIKRIAHREIRMLRSLRHENLVNLIEVFKTRRKHKLHLVFEYCEYTVLDEIEKHEKGVPEPTIKKIIFQACRGVQFMHNNRCIHRDIKPENILITKSNVIKLCDFGFARQIDGPNAAYTDYVATRWYRAPELLVGDRQYDYAVDIWAVGCLTSEMFTGQPLWPGKSDMDQLYRIKKSLGQLTSNHIRIFNQNPYYKNTSLSDPKHREPLSVTLEKIDNSGLDFIQSCVMMDPKDRATADQLLQHQFLLNEANEYEAQKMEHRKQRNIDLRKGRLASNVSNTLPIINKHHGNNSNNSTLNNTHNNNNNGNTNREEQTENNLYSESKLSHHQSRLANQPLVSFVNNNNTNNSQTNMKYNANEFTDISSLSISNTIITSRSQPQTMGQHTILPQINDKKEE
ncbi:hypothetical protein SNEBB_003577 [Seison nebaliae]|nr:hypothetical protein SNEBB_003577 [Seison nebaliae]